MKLFRKILVVLLFVSMLIGCIKEQRRLCPCRLILDMSSLDSALVSEAKVTVSTTDGYTCDTLCLSDFTEELMLLVPRSGCSLNVYADDDALSEAGKGLTIPYGEQCPSVYMYSAYLDTNHEVVKRSVLLRKNYCRLSICVEDIEHFSFSLGVRGNVSGYDASGFPKRGMFYCSSFQADSSAWDMSIPRQMDDSLLLEVGDGTAVLKTFALGKYIQASGYDWKSPDLKDIAVGIDYTRTKLTVSVKGWDEVYEFDVVI